MTIPIVLSSNNGYVPYMATTIRSIVQNSGSGGDYRIYIFHKDITPEYQTLLKKVVATKPNFQIEFVNVGAHFEKYALHTQGISIEAYYRLLIPYHFTEYGKVIYIDSDTICLSDIAELLSYDLGENMVGAVQGIAEIGWYRSTPDHYWGSMLKIKDPEKYFNSGLMVFNVEPFKRAIGFEDLLKLCEREKWPCYDQDVLNIVCEDRTYYFPYRWNFIKYHTIEHVSDELQTIYYEAEKNPCMVHFATGHKPWRSAGAPYAREFWEYATKTPFFADRKPNGEKKLTILQKLSIRRIVGALLRPVLKRN